MNREHVTAQAITALYRARGASIRATSVARREDPWRRHHFGGVEVARDRPQGTSAPGAIPEQEAGTRQFDRSEVRRVRASRPEIREGWPPHERTVQDGTATQSGSGRGSPHPRHGPGSAQRGDPERGEGRGTQRPPGRGGARGATGPRARAQRSGAPEAARGQRREPRAPAAEPGRAGVPKADERDGARAPAREQASGRARHRSAPSGVASRPARVEEGEHIHDDFGSNGRAVQTTPPTAHGTRRSSGGSGRRGPTWSPAAEPRVRPESRAGRRIPVPRPGVRAGRAGESPGRQPGRARGAVRPDHRADPRLSGAAGTANRQRPSGATPYGASRERLQDGRERDRSRSRGAGESRGWRRGARESGLRARITSFQDRSEPSPGAREGGRGEGSTATLAGKEGACTPATAGRAPSPSERASASRGLWRSARGVGHNGRRASGRGDAVRLPARSSSRGERVAGRQRTSRDSGSSTAQAETRRTSRPAAGRNRPVTPGWSKPSRRGGTAKAEHDSTRGSVGPKGAQVPGSGHLERMSVERRGVSEPQERRARAQRGSSALKGRSSWRGPALDPSGDSAGRPGKTSRVTRVSGQG